MTSLSALFLCLAALMAVLDWVAVAKDSAVLEYVSKPSATAALLLTAAMLDVSQNASWLWLLAALVLCLAGDVFLMLPRDAFIPGLASFALAQILFTVSFATSGVSGGRLVVGLIIAIPTSGLLARRFVDAIKKSGHGELVVPVVVYMVVISAMAVGSIAAGSVVAIAGAVLFMASDSLIAESRFVGTQRWHGVGIMVTYHLALTGLVLGLL
ncbi:MAG: hypothetical protein KJS66_10710 [Acidobacteria bacterium]|nr:hypothetical protein [Acidobacteriota bacterium]